MEMGQGVPGLVAPEDLLSACCPVLPLALSALVLSPFVLSTLVSSLGPLLDRPWVQEGLFWALLGCSWQPKTTFNEASENLHLFNEKRCF